MQVLSFRRRVWGGVQGPQQNRSSINRTLIATQGVCLPRRFPRCQHLAVGLQWLEEGLPLLALATRLGATPKSWHCGSLRTCFRCLPTQPRAQYRQNSSSLVGRGPPHELPWLWLPWGAVCLSPPGRSRAPLTSCLLRGPRRSRSTSKSASRLCDSPGYVVKLSVEVVRSVEFRLERSPDSVDVLLGIAGGLRDGCQGRHPPFPPAWQLEPL